MKNILSKIKILLSLFFLTTLFSVSIFSSTNAQTALPTKVTAWHDPSTLKSNQVTIHYSIQNINPNILPININLKYYEVKNGSFLNIKQVALDTSSIKTNDIVFESTYTLSGLKPNTQYGYVLVNSQGSAYNNASLFTTRESFSIVANHTSSDIEIDLIKINFEIRDINPDFPLLTKFKLKIGQPGLPETIKFIPIDTPGLELGDENYQKDIIVAGLNSNTEYIYTITDTDESQDYLEVVSFKTTGESETSFENIVENTTEDISSDDSLTLDTGIENGGLIVCDGPDCDFNSVMLLIKKLIDFLIFGLALPVSVIAFSYAGYLYLTSGANPGNRSKAKEIFLNVLIGFVIALSAWLIVSLILNLFGVSKENSLLGGDITITNTVTTNPDPVNTGGTCTGVSCPGEPNFCKPIQTNCFETNVNNWEQQINEAVVLAGAIGGVDTVKLMKAIIARESSGIAGLESNQGACGLTQLKPNTAREFAVACGASDFPANDTEACTWLKDDEKNAKASICMSIKYLKTLTDTCGIKIRDLAAGYNAGGQGACEVSANCNSVGGTCLACGGQSHPTKKWECLYDDDMHTVCNTGMKETRKYAPEVEYCYGKF